MDSFRTQNVEVSWLGHASFKIKDLRTNLVAYVDPYVLPLRSEKADLIFLTHGHYDHCDANKIEEIFKDGCQIIGTQKCANMLKHPVKVVGENSFLVMKGTRFQTVPAYNPNKPYHPRGFGLGYLINFGNVTVYHAGDTDLINEMKDLRNKITIALLPIGGTYTMDESEAAEAVTLIKPKIAIPMHFGKVVKGDASRFKSLVSEQGTEVILLDHL